MDWGKVVYVFFLLMSLTTTAGFLYDGNEIALYVAASVNLVSTLLKVGVRNLLSAELLASSLVADLHLIPAFFAMEVYNDLETATALAIGAVVANVVAIALFLVETAKTREEV
ncbi:MAG: DUF6394 family protein [Campylobacterales bacterium]|nr:DUF6394 family protein [Campylobacterales bacterium]